MGASQIVFLLGRTEFLNRNRAALLDFFEDHVRAWRWFAHPDNRAEAIRIVSAFMRQPAEALGYLFGPDDYYRDPFLIPDIANLQRGIDIPFEYKLAPTRIDVTPAYVDLGFVNEAKRRIEVDPGR